MVDVDKFIQHYASQYYDPVKAREYYLRTRELKGRTTRGMTEEQKSTWEVTKDAISTEKKSKIQTEEELRTQKVEAFRQRVAETQKRISEKLKVLSERLAEKAAADKERIEEERQRKIDSLPEIPKNISPEKRAQLQEKRKKEISDIREGASDDKASVSEDTKKQRSSASEQASGEREQMRSQLKMIVSVARESLKKAKETINADYEKVYQQEYDAIKKSPTKSSKSTGTKKTSSYKPGTKSNAGDVRNKKRRIE